MTNSDKDAALYFFIESLRKVIYLHPDYCEALYIFRFNWLKDQYVK